MWNTTLKLFGQRSESVFDQAGRRAWHVVVSYTKVTLTSACVDATVIGAASAIVGLPVAVSLGVIVFLFAFIPTVGAILSGTIVVLVGLVVKGPAVALALAIVVLVVQQLDANLMYPMLTSRYLSLHPLTSLLLVGAGAVVGGIVGALFAVPVAAVCIAIVGTVNEARTQQPAIQEVA